jgi:hypothetical protein
MMPIDATPISIDPDPLAPYAIAPGWRVGDLLQGEAGWITKDCDNGEELVTSKWPLI